MTVPTMKSSHTTERSRPPTPRPGANDPPPLPQPLVRDVMTKDVVVAFPDTRSADLAELVVALRLSAVPVTDIHDRLVGIVSTTDLPIADLLHAARTRPSGRSALWTSGRRPLWRHPTVSTVGELMTSPVVTTEATASITLAARLMVTHRVKQLPITDGEGRLCGIVTCRDLLTVTNRTDEEIRTEITTDVLGRYLPSVASSVDVQVEDGLVTLTGHVHASGMVPLAVHLIRRVDGVVDVVNKVTGGQPPCRHERA